MAIPSGGGWLNPYSGSSDYLIGFVYDKLFEPSPYANEPVPALAEWAEQNDPLTWTVRLRNGVTWHDGRPVTAADVEFTYEYFRDGPPNRYTHHVSEVPRIDEVVIVDSVTVRFVCGYPCPLLGRVTFADLPIIPRHVWANVDQPRQYAQLPVGSGPFRLVEYQPGRLYRFEANARYYAGAPIVTELVMPILPDQSSTFLALKAGEIDAAARDLPPELRAEFERLADIRVVTTAPLSIAELRPNYRQFPFTEPTFRRALSLAVDRDMLVERVLLGDGRPGVRGYPHPDSPWSDPTLSTPTDRARAEQLLRDLDFVDRDGDGVRETPDGVELRFTLKVNASEPTWVRSAELVAAQLTDMGIAVSVITLEAAALSQHVSARNYDLFISEIGPHGAADPDQFIMSHKTGYLWSRDMPYPAMDALYEDWRRTTDVESRTRIAFAMQRLFNDRPTSIALYYPDQHWAFRPEAHDAWAESRGYGIVHKWSLLPAAARARAVVREF